MADQKRKVHDDVNAAIDDFLNNGTGRGGGRNERPGAGTFKLELESWRAVGAKETIAMVKLADGTMQKATTVTIKGRVLAATVLESTSTANKVGSKVDLYFRANANEDWAQEEDIRDLVELVKGFYGCFGEAVNRQAYDQFVDAAGAKETSAIVAGVHIGLSARQAVKDGVPKTFGDGKPVMYYSWQSIPNTPEEVAQRSAA